MDVNRLCRTMRIKAMLPSAMELFGPMVARSFVEPQPAAARARAPHDAVIPAIVMLAPRRHIEELTDAPVALNAHNRHGDARRDAFRAPPRYEPSLF